LQAAVFSSSCCWVLPEIGIGSRFLIFLRYLKLSDEWECCLLRSGEYVRFCRCMFYDAWLLLTAVFFILPGSDFDAWGLPGGFFDRDEVNRSAGNLNCERKSVCLWELMPTLTWI